MKLRVTVMPKAGVLEGDQVRDEEPARQPGDRRRAKQALARKRTRKKQLSHLWLAGKTLGMIFQHPSTRTRVSLEAGMAQLGGQAIFLGVNDLQMKRGETIGEAAVTKRIPRTLLAVVVGAALGFVAVAFVNQEI